MKIFLINFFTVLACLIISTYAVFISKTPIFDGYSNTCEVYFSSASDGNLLNGVTRKDFFSLNNVKGQAFFVEKNFDVQSFLKKYNAQILFGEEIDGGISYYCYSKLIPYSATVKHKRVNIQIYRKNDGVKVGSPIIFGSF